MMNWFRRKEYEAGSSPMRDVWMRFQSNRWALVSLYLLLICLLIAASGYLLTPDKTHDGNRIIPQLALRKPFTDAVLLRIPSSPVSSRLYWMNGDVSTYTWYVVNEYRKMNDTLSILAFQGAGLPDTLIHFNSIQLERNSGIPVEDLIIKQTLWLGTDNLGRDILTRLMLGLRISLSVGLIAVFISLSIGIILGAVAGYYGGIWDKIIQWFINIIWAIPTVLLVFALTILLGKGFWQIFIAVGLTIWVSAARLIRGQVMALKQEQYIEAARSLGYGNFRIIFKHILPNIIGPILVIAASNFATAILLEAGLSFLGIGVQPPAPSWGGMIRDNYGYIISDTPYVALIPGFAIMFLVLLLNLIGNGLRDALDVKTKH